jgi:arylsulfatase A-like enzyme
MRRRQFLTASAALAATPVLLSACGSDKGSGRATRQYGSVEIERADPDRDGPDVLFIALDDQNDWLGFLNNHPGTRTPNLDALARESMVFTQAYTVAPMCAPSRAGVMFGQPPHISNVYDHSDASREAHRELEHGKPSLLDSFWARGYDIYGAGKVFARGARNRWSERYSRQPWVGAQNRRAPEAEGRFDPDWISPYDGRPIGTGESFRPGDIDFGPTGVPLDDEPEMENALWVAERASRPAAPKFLAYGCGQPHVPWRVPQRFIDQHPVEEVVLPDIRAEHVDRLGPYARDQLIDGLGAFERLRESGQWAAAVAHYQAATTFADHCIGVVLNELADSARADDTVVVLWSDHGFHLGEKLHLHKSTLWERATHVPLLIRAAGVGGGAFDRPVSLLDIGPTLTELCGVEETNPEQHGQSLLPLLDEPELADDRPPIMTWREGNHAVRRGSWRYIRYRTGEDELYDVEADPDELVNLTSEPEHAATVAELAEYLPDP